jgi:hypothetical protein
MALDKKIIEKISLEVIKTLITRFESFPKDASNNRNAPFHEAFLNAFSDKLQGKVLDIPFFISLSSWLQGLNTTLGQSFFENVANILCYGKKREFTQGKDGVLKITKNQKEQAGKIITNLKNTVQTPNLSKENNLILHPDNSVAVVDALGFSADVFYQTDKEVVAVELKSVKPNSGEMRGEKQKILEGKAALFRRYPGKAIKFFIGFPFDPTVDTKNKEPYSSFDKKRFFEKIVDMNKFFAHDETLVSSELWDFLSGAKNTMEDIISIINTISTAKFIKKFELLKDETKARTKEYLEQLEEWNLFSEIELLDGNDNMLKNAQEDKVLLRIFKQSIFDGNGKYNWERYDTLKKLL